MTFIERNYIKKYNQAKKFFIVLTHQNSNIFISKMDISNKEFSIFYYKDNGTVPPEYHKEFTIQIQKNGEVHIEEYTGYNNQLLFSQKFFLTKDKILFLSKQIGPLTKSLSQSSSIHHSLEDTPIGGPIEYIEIHIDQNAYRWQYPFSDKNPPLQYIYQQIQEIKKSFYKKLSQLT